MRKICIILLLLSVGIVSSAHNLRLSLPASTVREVTDAITTQTGILFSFQQPVGNTPVKSLNLDLKDVSVEAICEAVFSGTDLLWKVSGLMVDLFTASAKEQLSPLVATGKDAPKKIRITGTVKDIQDGQPLVGVVVRPKSRPQTGSSTDLDGLYVIEVDKGDALVFTYLGYLDLEVPVTGETVVDVAMQFNNEVLEEATVVGYGTQKKISLIGAQQSITTGELKVPVANLTQSIAGRVAGVVSMQRTGEPGFDDATIYIRGISTLTASMSAPLTIVDGVPRSISNIDPEDIDSFTVLKDASATAVYGVRGANGVIIINTKSGRAGKPKFDIRYTEGITQFTRLPEFVDAATYMRLSNEALETRGEMRLYSDVEIQKTASGEDPFLYPDVDWMKLLFKPFGHNRSATANISGGSDRAMYYIGLAYFNEDGMYNNDTSMHDYNANTFYHRYSVTSNITLKPFSTTEIKLGVQGYLANANYPATPNEDIFAAAFNSAANYIAPFYPGGIIGDKPNSSIQNPYARLNETGYANQWRNQLYSNLKITQDLPWITKGLSLSAMVSFDAYNYTSNRFTRSPITYMATGRDADGNLIYQQTISGSESLSYSNSSSGNLSIYIETGVNYNRSFGLHDVSAMLLYNQSDEKNTKASSVETALPYRFNGLAGRATYAFDERYFAEFNFGYNGSENFAPSNRYGFFPSGGLGWVISNEEFFKPLKNVVSFLKLRATYGLVGNSRITGRRFAYLSTINSSSSTAYTFGQQNESSYTLKRIGEEGVNVSWETAKKLNIGLDIHFLNNNLSFHADYFKDRREGIFLTRGDIPAYVGLNTSPLGNLGKVNNEGFELSVDYHQQLNKDWFVSFMGNLSYNHNTVIENDVSYAYPWLDVRGQRVGQRYGFIAEKLFETEDEVSNSAFQTGDTRPGDIKYKDINADGKIDDYDKVPIGYGSTPGITYGLGFNIAWKSISLSAMFQGTAMVDALISGQGVMPFQQGMAIGNVMTFVMDRWTEQNPSQNVQVPRLSPSASYNMNYQDSSWWLRDTSYLRLKNLQITYSLPKRWTDAVHLAGASVYLQGVNILTFSKFKLWDVEQSDGRGDVYPNTKSYSLGINFNF